MIFSSEIWDMNHNSFLQIHGTDFWYDFNYELKFHQMMNLNS